MIGTAVSALRLFFKVTLDRPGWGDRLASVPRPDRLPVVLSPEEVALLLHCAGNLPGRSMNYRASGLVPRPISEDQEIDVICLILMADASPMKQN
jgi:hypothetical protein